MGDKVDIRKGNSPNYKLKSKILVRVSPLKLIFKRIDLVSLESAIY